MLAVCKECPNGKYQNAIGSFICKECPNGKYQNATRQSTCRKCAPGYFGSESARQTEACSGLCPPGTDCSAGGCATATPLIPGRVYTVASDGECTFTSDLCPRGSFCLGGAATPCSAATFAADRGAVFCQQHTVCIAGEKVGAVVANTTADRTCNPCPIDFYSNSSNAAVCFPCPIGKYQTLVGQPFCDVKLACIPGRYDSNPARKDPDRCSDCAAGKFSSSSNLLECTSCAAGQLQSEVGRTFCVEHTICAAGSNVGTSPSSTSNRICEACGVGKFSSVSNSVSCPDCPDGKYQLLTGQPFCSVKIRCRCRDLQGQDSVCTRNLPGQGGPGRQRRAAGFVRRLPGREDVARE